MGTFILDEPSLFIVPGRASKSAQGYLRIFRCSDYNNKSNITGSDFDWVGDIDVLKYPVIYDSIGNPLVKQQTTHDDIYVAPCSCPIKGDDLLRLYQKLRKYHMIVNSAGQVMLALDDDNGKVYADEAKKILVSEYLRCADVFLWSEFGAPVDSTLCKLFVRFQLFTDHRVDDLQQELEDCRSKPKTPTAVGNKQQALEKQLNDVKQKLATEELKVKEVQKEKSELDAEVKKLKAKLAECEKKKQPEASGDVEACERKYKKIIQDMRDSQDREVDRHMKSIENLGKALSACEAEKETNRRTANDLAVVADKRLITIREIRTQLISQHDNSIRNGWGAAWFQSWVKTYAQQIDWQKGY